MLGIHRILCRRESVSLLRQFSSATKLVGSSTNEHGKKFIFIIIVTKKLFNYWHSKLLLFFRGDYNHHEQSPSQWFEFGVADGIEAKPGESSRGREQGRHPHIFFANNLLSWSGHNGNVQARHKKGNGILARFARHLVNASRPWDSNCCCC